MKVKPSHINDATEQKKEEQRLIPLVCIYISVFKKCEI